MHKFREFFNGLFGIWIAAYYNPFCKKRFCLNWKFVAFYFAAQQFCYLIWCKKKNLKKKLQFLFVEKLTCAHFNSNHHRHLNQTTIHIYIISLICSLFSYSFNDAQFYINLTSNPADIGRTERISNWKKISEDIFFFWLKDTSIKSLMGMKKM